MSIAMDDIAESFKKAHEANVIVSIEQAGEALDYEMTRVVRVKPSISSMWKRFLRERNK